MTNSNHPTPEEVDAEQKAYAEATANSTGYPQPGDTPYNSPVPGTEVTQTPGLIPETTTEYDPSTANVDTAVPPSTTPDTMVPPTTTGTEWDGTINPPSTSETIDYAAAVDHQVSGMPVASEAEVAHQELMHQPAYAIATHEHQLNKIANMLEELCARVVAIEERLIENEQNSFGHDPNNPINDYPEVQAHQNQ